ncbi:MAG: tRNA (guanosine(46)-N7)-methyltransferase TrmB [Propionibacteriaceae bacterium]|jgi:tRNA (guanine-N7-)-methyltransferase|nr:tRNA (guanosine(46)-N7)-methyltransferase TrmB [Propionibacteriaceae bacterium]
MNPSQQRAWDALHVKYVIEVPRGERRTSVSPAAEVDWAAEFGRSAPLYVEVGSGDGTAITALAQRFPEANLIGFEVFVPTLASTLSKLERAGVENVRMLLADAEQGLEYLFAPGSLSELWTFFPDPWHKKKHHKRRLVNPRFAASVATALAPGGIWRLATDWEDYADWMREVLAGEPRLAPDLGGELSSPRWEPRPVTRFEQRAITAGRRIQDLTYVRI